MKTALFLSISLLLFAACKKEIKPHLARYTVNETFYGGPTPPPGVQYDTEVEFENARGKNILISDMGVSGTQLNAKVDGKSFTVDSEKFISDSDLIESYEVISGSGTFFGDSVSYEIVYKNDIGDINTKSGKGVKM